MSSNVEDSGKPQRLLKVCPLQKAVAQLLGPDGSNVDCKREGKREDIHNIHN